MRVGPLVEQSALLMAEKKVEMRADLMAVQWVDWKAGKTVE